MSKKRVKCCVEDRFWVLSQLNCIRSWINVFALAKSIANPNIRVCLCVCIPSVENFELAQVLCVWCWWWSSSYSLVFKCWDHICVGCVLFYTWIQLDSISSQTVYHRNVSKFISNPNSISSITCANGVNSKWRNNRFAKSQNCICKRICHWICKQFTLLEQFSHAKTCHGIVLAQLHRLRASETINDAKYETTCLNIMQTLQNIPKNVNTATAAP